MIIKFRTLYLKMKLGGEVFLDVSGLDLPSWFFTLRFASKTPKHTLSSSKEHTQDIRVAMDKMRIGGWRGNDS